MHIETYTKKLELKAAEGWLVGCSNSSNSYHVYNPATRRIMASRNAIFIEIPSCLLPPLSEEMTPEPLRWEVNDHNFITDDDFLRDIRDLTSVLDPLPGSSADYITVGGLPMKPQVAELSDRISDITGKTCCKEDVPDYRKTEFR